MRSNLPTYSTALFVSSTWRRARVHKDVIDYVTRGDFVFVLPGVSRRRSCVWLAACMNDGYCMDVDAVTMLHTDPNAMGLSSPYLIQEAHHTFGTIDNDNSGTIDMHELGAVRTSRISHTCRPWLRRTSDPACLHCVACACGRIPPLPLMNHTHLYTHLSCTFCLACRGCVALRYACC